MRAAAKLLLPLVLAVAQPALAQPDDPGLRARVRERVRAAVEEKLIAALQLDAAGAGRLRGALARFDGQIAALQHDTIEAHHQLEQYLDGGGADAATIQKLTDRVLDNRERVHRLESERTRAVREVLTPQQYGRLVVVFPRVTKEVRKELWKSFAGHHGAPPDDGE